MIAIRGAGCRINKTPDSCVARGDQHVEESGRVRGVGAQRIRERPRNRAQRSLVQYDIDRIAHAAASIEVDDIGFDERVAFPRSLAHFPPNLIEVPAMAGFEIIDADDVLIEPQECFQQMRADESGAPGDQPPPALLAHSLRARQRVDRFAHCGHHSLHTVTPRARNSAASAWHLTSTYSPPCCSLST